MSYTTNLEIQDEIIGKMGLGVDYYKGEPGMPGKDGKDGSDQVYVGADEPTDERVKLWIDTDATPPSKTISWDEIENKPEIPAPYTLPTASTSSLGVVKPDGTTVTVDDKGNLSMIGKLVAIRTLITGQAPDWVVDWVAHPDNCIVMVNNCVVFKTMKSGTNFYYYWIDGDRIEHYYIKFTDTTFTTPDSSQPDYSMAATQLITDSNWQNYITVSGGGDWQTTQSQSDSNLYNAKEMIIYWEYNNEYRMNYYNFTYNSNLASYAYQTFNTKYDYSIGSSTWQYDGSSINTNNMNIQVIYYKT